MTTRRLLDTCRDRSRRALHARGVALLATPAAAQLCNPLGPLPGDRAARRAPACRTSSPRTSDDLAFTNGYVEAQDRLFEMEVLRRAGQGTLSEVLGAVAARHGHRRSAATSTRRPSGRRSSTRSRSSTSQTLTSFAEGVNRYICEARLDRDQDAGRVHARSASSPRIGRVLDSVAAADFLIGVFGVVRRRRGAQRRLLLRREEPRRARPREEDLQRSLPALPCREPDDDPAARAGLRRPAARRSTQPLPRPAAAACSSSYVDSIYRAAGVAAAEAQAMAAQREALGIPAGGGLHASNAILVSGSKSDTGNPILLGGPQVGYAIPSFFFEVGLHLPTHRRRRRAPARRGRASSSAARESFAYTVTSGISDQVDTYLEVLNPANPRQYLFNGSYRDMELPHRDVHGAGAAAARRLGRRADDRAARALPHGARPRLLHRRGGRRRLQPPLLDARPRAPQLGNWLRMALDDRRSPSSRRWSTRSTCRSTTTSPTTPGTSPTSTPAAGRSGRARSDPRFPLPGTGEWEWTGFLAKSAMPRIKNPAQGWLANWNNNPIRGWSSGDIRELWGTRAPRAGAAGRASCASSPPTARCRSTTSTWSCSRARRRTRTPAARAASTASRPCRRRTSRSLPRSMAPAGVGPEPRVARRRGRPDPATGSAPPPPSPMTAIKTGIARRPDRARLAAHRHERRRLLRASRRGALRALARDPPAPRLRRRARVSSSSRCATTRRPAPTPAITAAATRRTASSCTRSGGRGPSGRRTVRYFDDIGTPGREIGRLPAGREPARRRWPSSATASRRRPCTCRHANHVNVFTSLGGAPDQTIGATRGGVNRGSYNQIIELAPTLFSVNVQPPGQSGHINAVLLAQIQARARRGDAAPDHGRRAPDRPARALRALPVQADAVHAGRGHRRAVSGRRTALVFRQVVIPTVAVLRLVLLTAAFLLLAGCVGMSDASTAGT